MKAKQKDKNTKKPQRKLPDLAPKKDVHGGFGDFVMTSTTSSSSPTIQK
jgi:hypothetical protein